VVVPVTVDRVQRVARGVEGLQPQPAGRDVAPQRRPRPGVGEQVGEVGVRGGRPSAV
jgi:hypothetical protein